MTIARFSARFSARFGLPPAVRHLGAAAAAALVVLSNVGCASLAADGGLAPEQTLPGGSASGQTASAETAPRQSADAATAAMATEAASAPLTTPLPAAAAPAALLDDPLLTARMPPPQVSNQGPGILPRPSRGRLDALADPERSDLWQRLRDGFTLPDVDGDLVRKWEQWYARDPAYVQRMTTRGGRYLFYIIEEVQRRGMPAELALLPFIESAFNPQAESRASASGMWQFMPATGKDFELRQNLFRDDRRDVLASTRAALDYLQQLNTMFEGDWQLALAAYNWGLGNVKKGIERNRRGGLPADYASLRMPQETREYVPKLQAVKNIVLRPEFFALRLLPLENHPFFLSVSIVRDIDVALAARLAGLPLEEFQQLNPQMNKPVILAAGTPQVLLPYDNANRFLRALPEHRGALASWTAWEAPRTLKPADAARLTGMSEADLRQVNRIPPRMLVRAGSTLLVPRAAHSMADVAEHLADNGALALSPEARPRRAVAKTGRAVAKAGLSRKPGATAAAAASGRPVAAAAAKRRVVAAAAPAANLKRPPAAAASRVRLAQSSAHEAPR